jgi:glycosyltransferase involved in cell wall biosynthesis
MPGRGLEPAIEALAGVPGLRMALVGPGAESYRGRLLALAERAGVADRVELRAAVAPDDVVAAVQGASFGLMLIEPVCRSYELTLPNKLFEYAAAGVPMLAGDLPVIGALVRRHDLGEAVSPADVGQVAAAMRRLLEPDRNRELRRQVAAFAAGNTWAREREALSAVYAGAMGSR